MFHKSCMLLSVIFMLGLGVTKARAEDTLPQVKGAIVAGKSGELILEVTGVAPDKLDWLGVSFYLPNYVDPIWEGEHTVVSVKKGAFQKSFSVPGGFETGTWEIALWKSKVAEKIIYKLQEQLAYVYGATQEPADR